MKKLVLILYLIVCSFDAFSQIEVIEITPCDEVATFKKYITVKKCRNTYMFIYLDVTYKQIIDHKSFEFEDIDSALYKLYEAIIKGFDQQPKGQVMINLPNDVLILNYPRLQGVNYFQFVHAVNKSDIFGRSIYMTRKQVVKFFSEILE